MMPVIRFARMMVGSLDDPAMLADDLPLRRDGDPVRIEPHADRTVGEGGRNAVAVALDMDQAGRRHPLGLLDKAIERPLRHHEARALGGPDFGDAARQAPMGNLPP